MTTAGFALKHAATVAFIAVVLALLGVRSYLVAPESIFPAMYFSRVDVVAEAGDLPPERVRIAVTRPLETAFQTLPSVSRVRATSSQGSADLTIEFAPSTDPRTDLQYVDQAIASLRADVPAAKTINAVVVNPNAEPAVSYMVHSRSLSQAALREFIQTRVIPIFAGTPGLGRITAVGGPPIEYHVELDPGALAATSLSATDVATAIADANSVSSVGTATHYHERFVLLIDASLRSPHDIERIAVPMKAGGTVPLRSLGRVVYSTGLATNVASTRGTASVNINAYPLPGADAVSLQRAVVARMATAKGLLPADTVIEKYWDQTRLIVDSQASLRDAILLGAALAVLVIYIFLRNIRMTLIAATVIPLAMAITILALERSGQSLNLMSVGGLAVAVGLIIDDAIVVIEAIARGVAADPDGDRVAVIARSAGALAAPMAASTATTVVVFIPLGLLSGVPGFFFRALAFTLATSLLVSLALALFVTPVLARSLLARGRQRVAHGEGLDRIYAPILRWALRRRLIVYLGAAVVLATTALLLLRLPSDFLPHLDEGEFEIKYTLPPGATLADSNAAAKKMERIVVADPAVVTEGRLTGIDTNGYSPTQPNIGTIRATLTAGGRAPYDAIAERLRSQISAAVPAATLDFHQLLEDSINDLSGAPQPIEISVTGPDQTRLITIASDLADKIGKVPGVVDAFNGITYDDPTLQITPSAGRLTALGTTSTEFADALSARLQGNVTTQIAGTSTTIPVRVNVAGPGIDVASSSGSVFLHGGTPALEALARTTRPGLATDVNEVNGRRLVRITANIQNRSLSEVVAGLQGVLRKNPLPAGYSAVIGGTYESQQASFREFASVIAIAVALVFSVMLATFGSFRLPLVILCAIPLALLGVAIGLAVTGTPLNVSSFMGLLLLVGIVVKNGILLIDVANRRRAAGDDVNTALLAAGTQRLRPILMTTLAAIGGLFPLALGLGAGAEMEKPLAIAVIGGLSTATAFTLVVIPVLYASFTGGSGGFRFPTLVVPGHRRRVQTGTITLAMIAAIALGMILPASGQTAGASTPAGKPASAGAPSSSPSASPGDSTSGGSGTPASPASASPPPGASTPTQPAGPQSGTNRPGAQPAAPAARSGSPTGPGGAIPGSQSGASGSGSGTGSTTGAGSGAAAPSVPDLGLPPGGRGAPGGAAVQPPLALAFLNISLSDAQASALRAAPDIRSSRASLASAQATFAQVRGTNGLAATVNYTETPQGSSIGTIAARVTNVGATISLADLLAYPPLVAQAAATLEGARTDALVAERTERVKVVTLYYSALKARALFNARAGGATNATAFVASAQKRFSAGDVPRLDIIRAQVAAAQSQADLANARASDTNATDALARELGTPFAVFASLRGGTQPLIVVPDPDRAVQTALANRGDLRSAQTAVRAAQLGVEAVRRQSIPAISLGAGYSKGVDSGVPISGPTLSAQLTLPLSGANAARVRLAQSLVEVAFARREGIAKTIATDVSATARTAQATLDARRATAAAVEAARQEYNAATLGYASGASTSFEVTQARSTYALAIINDLSALYDALQNQAILQLEVGT